MVCGAGFGGGPKKFIKVLGYIVNLEYFAVLNLMRITLTLTALPKISDIEIHDLCS
jgi:hypothetical protein